MRAERAAACVGAMLLVALTGCGIPSHAASRRALLPEPVPARSAPAVAEVWLTTADRAQQLTRQRDLLPSADTAAATRITIDTAQTYQAMLGFGAAITDASAHLLQTRLPAAARETLLQELFGRAGTGVGFSAVRLTIGASDYSRTHYTLNDIAAGTRDDGQAQFSIDPMRAEVLPVVRRAREINPALTVMATPWSAPAWMKSTGSLIKGTLRPDAYGAYARYLWRYLVASEAAGVPIAAITVQNEPHHEPADYPGMRFDPPQRAEFIARHLGPLLTRRGVRTAILDWDHNWDEPGSPMAVLENVEARRYVSGVAWHCYAGDVTAQSRVHEAFPDKDTWFTECAGGDWAPNFGDNLVWNTRTLIIGATRNWARTVILWNMALDEKHGPHRGGCNDCRGVVTIDSATGAITRNEEFYALAHASRFVRPGALRVASSSGTNEVHTVAFRNTDDGSIALIAVNASPVPRAVVIGVRGRMFRTTLPGGAVSTVLWR